LPVPVTFRNPRYSTYKGNAHFQTCLMNNLLLKNEIASEAEIIEKVIAGEVALFEVLIRRCNPVLYKIARGYGYNHQDAEDLMQETHVAAYQNLRQFSFKASYKTWISKIMINKCLYKQNHGYSKNEQPGTDIITEDATPMLNKNEIMTPEAVTVNKEFSSVLEQAVQKLPLNYRSAFLLREVEGFSVAETAELLNISEVNVKVRCNRAKTMLQKQLVQFYTSGSMYEFNLIYCDGIVQKVYNTINSLNQ
jgi:RNA polymerase sigma factor (sigma-70 family)